MFISGEQGVRGGSYLVSEEKHNTAGALIKGEQLEVLIVRAERDKVTLRVFCFKVL